MAFSSGPTVRSLSALAIAMTPEGNTRGETGSLPFNRPIFGSAVLPSPQQIIAHLVFIREGGDLGFIGRYISDPSVIIEVCFDWDPRTKKLGETPLLSVIIARGKKTLFEFFMGATVKMPSREDAQQFVLPLIQAFTGYRPQRVDRRIYR